MATTFAQGASDARNHVEKVELRGKTIQFCRGCLTCQRTGKCVTRDDVEPILHKMLVANVIVFATPIYYYEMCGQMKTVLDRANPLHPLDYAFRDVWLLMTAK